MRTRSQTICFCGLAGLVILALVSLGCTTAHVMLDRFMSDFRELTKSWKAPPEGSQETLKIESITCEPKQIKPGKELEVLVEYSVRPPETRKALRIREEWVLKRGEMEISTLAKDEKERERGTYQIGGRIQVPKSVQQGKYTIEQKIETCPSDGTQDCLNDVMACAFEVSF